MEGGYEVERGYAAGVCEGGLGQQRNDGGGCTTMRERQKRVERPGACVIN